MSIPKNTYNLVLVFALLIVVQFLHKTTSLPWGSVLWLMMLAVGWPGLVDPNRNPDIQEC